MASITKEKNGCRRILFMNLDGERKSIRLGKVSQRFAEGFKLRVEHLLTARLTGQAIDREILLWVNDLEGQLAEKLAKVGLIPSRNCPYSEAMTLASFIDGYIESRPDIKPNTLMNYNQAKKSLVRFLGEDRLLNSITPGDADEWHARQVADGYAPATISRHAKRAKQFFRAAIRKKLIDENPFQDIKAPAQVNKTREHFVERKDIDKIMEECPDVEWKLIIGLARYGGLRTPSETLELRWKDIDWARKRIRVTSPKTAHHAGGESRIIPLFPELQNDLDVAWELAKDKAEFVISRYRDKNSNFRTHLLRMMKRAGVAPWPRLFQNMRASRETELTQEHPLHVVVNWIGNSALIASKHYLQIREVDFEKATMPHSEVETVTSQS